MYNVAHLNIAIESFGLLASVILLFLLKTGGDRNSRLDRLFARLILLNIFMLASDMLSWIMEGNTAAYSVAIMHVAVFLAYSIPLFFGVALYYYIVELIGEKTSIPKIYPRMVYLFICVDIVFIVISLFNGMIYYIDRHNTYHVGELFWLYQAMSLAFPLVLQAVIWRYRKKMKTGEILFLSSYIVILVITGVFQMFFIAELELVFVGTTLCVLLIYGGIQVRKQREHEMELAEARVAVMLSQIQPHFLFNSLAAIQHLCQTDPKQAEETVVEFTKYLRGNIDALSLKMTIPFEKELEHTKSYLAIEKRRFGKKLNIEYEITTRDFFLPALTLQPIVENAVRYGITKRDEGGTVAISTSETETGTVLTVTDDGAGFDVSGKLEVESGKFGDESSGAAASGALVNGGVREERSHVGIENVRNRLEAMCGGTLEVQSRPGAGTTVIITIPK